MKDKLDFLVPGGGLRGPLLAELAGGLDAAGVDEDAEAAEADRAQGERELADAARVGEQVGPFKLVGLLGSGGMGTVYLAERTEGNFTQAVALKVVRGGPAGADARERFEQERQILARLRHPNIAQLLDGGETREGHPYFTLEYVEGVPITSWCRDHADGLRERLQLLLQVASALAYAHQNLVIHRDIKPSNILVAADRRVKLLDFGISKLFAEAAGPALTRQAFGPMTPEYAAPEQFRGGAITTATDIYQFGVLMFRLLTGRLPYLADPTDPVGWARTVCEDEPLTLSRAVNLVAGDVRRGGDGDAPEWATQPGGARRLARQLRGDLDAIARKALAKTPDRGYRSMDALIADLEAFLDGRPVLARRPSAVYHARRFLSRHPIAVAITGTLAALLIGVTTLALRQAAVATREAERSKAALNFVADWFKAADPYANNGAQLTAHTMFEQGARRLRTELPGQPGVSGRLEHIIAQGFVALGETGDALPHFERAIALLRQDAGGDPLLLAAALEGGASAAENSSRMAQALQWLAEADALTREDSAATVDIRVNVLADRVGLERDRGNERIALELGQQAVALSLRYDPEEVSERSARALSQLGALLKNDGRIPEALEAIGRAHAALARLYGPEDLRTVSMDERLGWVLIDLGRFDEAEEKLELAATHVRAAVGENTRRYANNLYDRALLYRARGELQRAHDAFVEVARIHANTYAPNPVARGWTLREVAELDMKLDHPAQALANWTEIERIWNASMPPDSPVLAEIWRDTAGAYLALGRTDEATESADRALVVLRAQSAGHELALAGALEVRGEIESRLGHDGAAQTLLAEALAYARRDKSTDPATISEYERRLAKAPKGTEAIKAL